MTKRVLTLSAVLSLLFLAAAIPSPARAAGMSVGPYVWYAWWMPCFKDIIKGRTGSELMKSVRSDYQHDPAFLFGPAFSINWGNWSWSTVFVAGRYETRSKNIMVFTGSSIIPQVNTNRTYKYDLDSALNYTINKFIKFFVGFKYQHYSLTMNTSLILPAYGGISGYFYRNKDMYHGPGMGVGTGLTFNLVENFYLLWNLSLTGYCPIVTHTRSGASVFGITSMPIKHPEKRIVGSGIGPNTTLSFAYYVEPARLTVALGFRYQYIYFFGVRLPAVDNTLNSVASKSDHFFGINLSVVYSFNFSKQKDES